MGAMTLVAVEVLDASDLRVSLMFAVAGIVSAVLALPLGSWVEHRRKRPVMILANLLRAVALLSVPVAHVAGVLSYAQLVAVAAVSFVLASLGLRTIARPEPDPPAAAPDHQWRRELLTGWRYLLGHPTMRPLFFNAMLFGAMIIASSPLIQVLMLRELGLAPWQFGLALGLPCLGGILGAALAPWLERRPRPQGVAGMIVIIASDTLLLVCAGAFNPMFVAHRMAQVPDHLMARTSTAWSVTNRVVQPVAVALAGVLALLTTTRWAILVLAVRLVASSLILPWRRLWNDPPAPVETEEALALRSPCRSRGCGQTTPGGPPPSWPAARPHRCGPARRPG